MPFKIIPTLVYLVLLPILLALGNWQLNRAEEKRQFLVLQEQQANSEVMALSVSSQDDVQDLRYKKVRFTGHYDVAHQFLLDNQVYAGKAGYFVLTPFVLESGAKAVLVNRGWLPLTPNRAILPDVKFTSIQTTITGRINQFPSVGIKLPEADIPAGNWPSVVQVADSSILAKKLGYPLFSFQVELDKHFPDGYTREWQTSTLMPPEQHTAYAMQWFALALTLTLLFIVYSLKKSND
ncbi:MAG: SURF1 family protein [Methylovulum sp.]|uniref:SURF1 family protein n=1 Tax=Methylovulum sp. TaxID=1916980 RepID=UPI00261481F9|nr:SURF1 family protein [Methylovulum sp.]MDD2722778.1 SURF1 family protein [Methylovulum sp.]MDD5124558.1 SURF1 family protein [Methylovulum sp.]